MTVKDKSRAELLRELQEAAETIQRDAAILNEDPEPRTMTVDSIQDVLADFGISAAVLEAFARTATELVGDPATIDVETARRAAMIAVADQVWEGELGPLLSTAHVRELLGGISRQRVDELARGHRLISLSDSSRRRWFPVFQFKDGRPVQSLVAAFSMIAEATESGWTAAAWCVAPDPALDGNSPAVWAKSGRDPARLEQVARQDRGRLAQ